jgi:3-isopropylmalate dehydrogenase
VNASLDAGVVTVDIAEGKSFKTSEVGEWLAAWILAS